MAQIELQGVQKRFSDFTAVRESSFTIADGEFFVLLGPSGCGKTTTLRMIAGLELPTGGKILLDGEDVTYRRASQRDIGFVFQLFALYPHLSVGDNIAFPLKCQGVPRTERRHRVAEVARLLQIEGLLERSVSGLSSGDRQRVALGRAIVRRAKACMMDEPLGALDTEFRHLMCVELHALHERIHTTTVYVTHDQTEAMVMADRIAVMNHGVVEQIGRPQDVYDRPRTLHVAGFIGSPGMNFLSFTSGLRAGQDRIRLENEYIDVPTLREALPSRELTLGVRPEHVRISDAGSLRAEVFGVEYMGTLQIVTTQTAHGVVKVRMPSRQPVRVGETVGLSFETRGLILFDTSTGRAIRSQLFEESRHG